MHANDIIAKAKASAESRADNEWSGDWTNVESYRAFVRVLRSANFWQTGAREVSGTVEDSRYGRIWSHVIAECLDSAASELDFPDTTLISDTTLGAKISW